MPATAAGPREAGAAGSSSAAVAAAAPPPPTRPVSVEAGGCSDASWRRRVHIERIGVLASCAMQAAYLLRQWHSAAPRDNFFVAASVLHHFVVLALMSGKGAPLYRRYRVPIYATMRPLGYLNPSVRSIRAAASQLLATPASPGALGALADLKRVLLATRTTGTAVIGVVVAMPPLVALLVQSVSTYLASNSAGYCSTELLRDPLSQMRLSRFAGALDLLSLPLSAVVPIPNAERAPEEHAAKTCQAFLAIFQLLLAVELPLLLLARWDWGEPPREPPAGPLPTRWPARALRRAQRAATLANWGIWRACTLSRSLAWPLVGWLLVSVPWVVIIAALGL